MKYPTSNIMMLLIGLIFFFNTHIVISQNFPQPQKEEGFVTIFNGNDLENWEGDPQYWSVKAGVVRGEVTAENLLEENSFLIFKDSVNGNFEIKVSYRVSSLGNSGINYRSSRAEGKPFALKGYQADIDGKNQWTGQNYEERGRTFLALRGQVTKVEENKPPQIMGATGDMELLIKSNNQNDWNEYHIILRENVLIHLVNGQVMSIVIDNDEENRRTGGLVGIQVHVGPPMKVEFKDFRIKKY